MGSRSGYAGSYLRLTIALMVITLSLLILVPAPTHSLWQLSIAVGERGYLLVPLAFLTAFLGRRPGAVSRLATVVSLFAAAVLLIPVMQAAAIGSHLGADIDRAFGAQPGSTERGHRGLSVTTLLKRSPATGASTRTLAYPLLDDSGKPMEADSLRLDFYPARSNRNAPLVVMIHGGSWQSGTRADLPELSVYLAELGYAVAAVSYRFAPAHPFPAALEDVRSGLRFLRNRSGELGIDTTRIVFAGRSAGGQLALLAAYTASDASVRGAIGLYAPADLIWGYQHPSDPRVLNSTTALEAYLAGSPTSAPASYRDASPLNFADGKSVPTLLIHGARDELVSVVHSQRLDERLSRAGARHFLLQLPWATHGCDYFLTGPCGQLATLSVRRFLAIVTR